jgi:predicted nuclease with RNAse H fold
VYFIGIDLGWKMNPPRERGTALCTLSSRGQVEKIELVTTDEEIINEVTSKNHIWVGIDAPLIIPDHNKLRKCEKTLFSRGVRLLPTNRLFFERKFGGCRGEILASKLLSHGFRFPDQLSSEDRILFEVYPYGLLYIITHGKVPSYKKGGEYKRREHALRALHLASQWEPSLEIPSELKDEINRVPRRDLTGVADKIDALLSALCVYSHWINRGRRTESIGDNDDGFIILPRQEAID